MSGDELHKSSNLDALLDTPALRMPVTALPSAQHGGDENALSADSHQFLAAWKTWRREYLVPRRRDMDIVSIARLMPQLVLLDVFDAARTAFRLAGNDIEQLLGARLLGRDYLDMVAPELRACRGALLWQAVTRPVGLTAFYAVQLANGRRHDIQICAAPIQPDEPDAPMQLLAVASNLPHLYRGETVALTVTGFRLHLMDLGAGLPVLDV